MLKSNKIKAIYVFVVYIHMENPLLNKLQLIHMLVNNYGNWVFSCYYYIRRKNL